MPLQTTAAVRNLINAGEIPEKLIEIQLSNLTLRLTTGGHNVSWSGQNWVANGFIIEEPRGDLSRELRSTSDRLTVTAVDQTILASLMNANQLGRRVIIREYFTSPSGSVIPDPYIIDEYIISDFSGAFADDSASVSITLAGEFADFEFKNGIRTTDASLRRVHSGDRLFQYSKQVSKELDKRWGGR